MYYSRSCSEKRCTCPHSIVDLYLYLCTDLTKKEHVITDTHFSESNRTKTDGFFYKPIMMIRPTCSRFNRAWKKHRLLIPTMCHDEHASMTHRHTEQCHSQSIIAAYYHCSVGHARLLTAWRYLEVRSAMKIHSNQFMEP